MHSKDTPDGLMFHDTRHTAATRMLQSGLDLKMVGSILGHSDLYMTMVYAHATPRSRQLAVNALDEGFFSVQNESIIHIDEIISDYSIPIAKSEKAY